MLAGMTESYDQERNNINAWADTEKYLTVLPHANWPHPFDNALLLCNFLKTYSPLAGKYSPAFSLKV